MIAMRVCRPKDKRSKREQQATSPSFDTLTHTHFVVRSIPAVQPKPGWNASTCTLFLDTSRIGGTLKGDSFVGFADGLGELPAKFEEMTKRNCLIYRVVDVSAPTPWQDPRVKLQQGAALLTGVGPIDGDSADMFSHYSEEIDVAILVNRLCFARRENMDLLFLVSTKSMQHGQSPFALKAKGLIAALREYAVVVWMDMDGVTPLVPRPASRTCVPFTNCWPHSTEILLPRAPQHPYNPSSALMLFRRSSQAMSFLSATLNSPSRSSMYEEVVLADAVLSVLHEQGSLRYAGQCSRPGATLSCWSDVFAQPHAKKDREGNQADKKGTGKLTRVWQEPVGGVQLAETWCDLEPSANLSLVCPCSPPLNKVNGSLTGLETVDGWCGEIEDADLPVRGSRAQGGRMQDNKRKGACDIQRCNDAEVLFVKFGPGAHFLARGPEVHILLIQSAPLPLSACACICLCPAISEHFKETHACLICTTTNFSDTFQQCVVMRLPRRRPSSAAFLASPGHQSKRLGAAGGAGRSGSSLT